MLIDDYQEVNKIISLSYVFLFIDPGPSNPPNQVLCAFWSWECCMYRAYSVALSKDLQ